MPKDGSGVRRVGVAVMAMAIVFAGVAVSSATPDRRLQRTREDLQSLVSRIEAATADLEANRVALAEADQRLARAEHRSAMLQHLRAGIDAAAARAEARYEAARLRLNDAAAQAFIDAGAGSLDPTVLGAVLGAGSFEEIDDRVVYSSSIAQGAIDLANAVAAKKARLDERSQLVNALLRKRTAADADLEDARAAKLAAIQMQESAIASLDSARRDAVALIGRLRDRLDGLNALDLSHVADALQGEHHVSYGRWAGLFLRVMGAPVCRNNLVVIVSWQVAESTQAAWNPLATTHRMDGSTDFNSVGVQNYLSLAQGLQATKETIDYGWDVYGYGAIVLSLRACDQPMRTASAINLSRWCYGCVDGRYVLNIVPAVDADLQSYAAL
jgi:hypothetical protein